ncbi:MAG: cache domain-containing protein, partial [Deltaproteobacteria bacterium]|nr:cache domain-containing protein [Deltaproteobacteria bacterium]
MKRLIYSLKSILLFSFALVGGLPILVMGFVVVRHISADIAQEVREKNLLIAQSLSSEVHLFLQRSFSFLKQVDEIVIEKRYIQEDDITAYLGSSLKTNGNFESVEILDAVGIVRYMAPSDPDVIGINRSGQEYFSHVRQQHQPYWSKTFISLSTGKPTVTLAIPVKGGMIVGYLDLASLNAVTDKISAGRQGQALMLDQEGTVIAHPDRQKIYERQNLSNLKLREQEKLLPEESISYRENDRDYLASLSRVPDTQWMVIVTVPADETFKPVARVRALFGTGAVIVVFGVVTIVFLSLRKAAYPLSQLVRDTRRIAEGDFIIEQRPSSYKEIDDLVAHFRHMAGELRSREDALLENNELLTLFVRHSPVYCYIKDVNSTRSIVMQASDNFQQMIGIPGYEMIGKTMEELYPPEFAAKITADDWTVVSEGNVLSLDEELNGRSYTTIKFPIIQGSKTLLAGYTIDITERK